MIRYASVEKLISKIKGIAATGPIRLRIIAKAVLETYELNGAMAELGTLLGGSAYLIGHLAPQKTLHIFDTFTGLPSDDTFGDFKQGYFVGNEQEVRKRLAYLKTVFHVGLFPETTKVLPNDITYSFVYVDGDIYKTTVDAINYFWPRLVKNGIMLLDDYEYKPCRGVKRAVLEYFHPSQITQTGMQCQVKKFF